LETYNKDFDFKKSVDAHLRNAFILADYLEADLLLSPVDYRRALGKHYDALVLANSSHYAPFFYIKKLMENNPDAEKFVISNEYNKAESVGGFKPFHLIANYENTQSKHNHLQDFYFLNINVLFSREPNALDMNKKTYDCIYYGTFRPDRAQYFKEYLQKPVFLSTSPRNFKKYKHIGASPQYLKRLAWQPKRETLNRFKYSLYIEDVYTHSIFNNLANRWYEAGFCNNVMLFDRDCENTIKKSEIGRHFDEIREYMVGSHAELVQKIKQFNAEGFEKHLAKQKAWRVGEQFLKQRVLDEIKEIIENKVNSL
jgi:hypothetical protein